MNNQEFMRGWTYAAKLTKIYDEPQCQMLCAFVPMEMDSPDAWTGFVSAMLSGYHEVAQ